MLRSAPTWRVLAGLTTQQYHHLVNGGSSNNSAARQFAPSAFPLTVHAQRFGRSQIDDIPTSTSRKPRGMHRGPGKRQISATETSKWLHWKKWELTMKGEWDELEPFRHLPKPKKQFGNEACEIIWPYALLMERKVLIHPFTKSVYVYYPQRTQSDKGAFFAKVAQEFSRKCLIPICFHNNHVYVETEMLLNYGDAPWIVVHCLDGRHKVISLNDAASGQWLSMMSGKAIVDKGSVTSAAGNAPTATSTSVKATDVSKKGPHELLLASLSPKAPHTVVPPVLNAEEVDRAVNVVLAKVLEEATKLGESVKDVVETKRVLHERPLQNSFIRVDYQWFGETPESRMQHLVKWMDVDEMKKQSRPMRRRDGRVIEGLNYAAPEIPVAGSVYGQQKRVAATSTSAAKFVSLKSPPRHLAMYSKRSGSSQVV